MSCEHVDGLISGLLDNRLSPAEREDVLRHLEGCRACRQQAETYSAVRSSLRAMASVPVPPRLAAQLRINASKHRARLLSGGRFPEWLSSVASGMRLSVDNLMRPLAVPFAGGVFSALLLFSSLVPTLAFQRDHRNDVPIMLFTEPALEEIGQSHLNDEDTVVEVLVDERGRVSDYATPTGKLTKEMERDLLFYRFTPATAFGYPTWGRVTVTFRRSGGGHIVVRG